MAERHEPFDFSGLRHLPYPTLLDEFLETAERLANLHEEIAYLRVSEKGSPDYREQRIIQEGLRDALIERKFLLVRLLEMADA